MATVPSSARKSGTADCTDVPHVLDETKQRHAGDLMRRLEPSDRAALDLAAATAWYVFVPSLRFAYRGPGRSTSHWRQRRRLIGLLAALLVYGRLPQKRPAG